MADRKIIDFPTLSEANDDDLILVSSTEDTYNMKVATLKAATKKVAEDAVEKAETALDSTEAQGKKITSMGLELDTKVDGAYVEDGYLYLTANGEIVAGPLGPFSGSGGGSGGGTGGYSVALTNLMDSRVLTVSGGTSVYLSFAYSSADENGDDGPGVGTLTVNNIKAATFAVSQGNNMIEISPYLVSGDNNVKLRVENSEASSRTLSYTITVISLNMTTPFDSMGMYTGSVVFNYTVTGSGTKNVHFLMDGNEIGSEEVASSGRSKSYTIPQQTAGAHVLTAYAEITVGGASVKSNTLTIGMMWTSASMSTPAVLSTFTQEEAVQGDILDIPYMIYDPLNEEAAINLSVIGPDSVMYSTQNLTVDRTAQSWKVQNYPVGAVTFRIACGTAIFEQTVNVAESGIVIEPVTDALALYFDPTGRSNNEDDPANWTGNNITASFSGVSFSNADGWLTDADGASVLRLLPGGSMNIPFKLFESDARDSGATVEVEMATHNVRDYDTVVMSCLSGGRGFKIASQYAQLNSEQSEVSMQFKEDEKVRVSFVIEPRNLHRLIYVFVNGIMCGAIQYPANDNFQQSPATGITIGAETSGIDVYRIRLYSKGLTRHEALDNYVADRSLLSERIDAAKRNDIFDLSENIVISKLPLTLPYMIIKCAELPQYKGDKKTCSIEYVNPADPSRSFTAQGVEIDVQGTSSSGYKKKNFKEKYKSGLTYTATGESSGTYPLRENSIPASAFCMKADVASSEGANNVELVRLYNDTVPYKTPPQQQDNRVRVGIDGLPCVIFWQNTTTGETRFWGKYNFNNEKSSEAVYGLTTGCESWEVLNNTSNRVLFKSADFSGTGWQDDFEARYPDGNTNSSKLAAMVAWVASTDRSAVSSESDKAARLTKFKNEFENHFVKAPMLFYYLFTEVFLMVDSRAKNFFPTTFDGVHWQPLPYDFDTAIGINNEGQLVFDYDLEDTDTVGGSPVFNGQDSVLWCNIRDAFADDLKTMYNNLRSGALFNYPEIAGRFAAHQSVWPEAIWNEDAWEKYLEPLEADNDGSYLTMLQGNKGSQREWWLYNGLRYRDSKYQCGDAQNTFITLRCYQVGDITVKPYSHIWPRIKYGSYTVTQRGKRNVPVTLACPLDNMSDTEVYIYSADRLAAIGDLSGLQVGYANFSMAVKLQSLKLGDGSTGYQNTRLNELYVGNNELLISLDVQNCVSLTQSVDLSGCVGIEEVKAKGSAVTGFTLPVGGKLKTLELPGTVTNLTLREQGQLQTLTMEGYSALTTLRIEYTPNVPLEAILNGAENLNRVRLIGVEWTAANETALQATITKLESCIGMDASGGNTEHAVVTGRVYVPSISADLLAEINDNFPQLVVVANGVPQYIVRYIDWNNDLLYRAVVSEGSNAVNPVTEGVITPTREGTEDIGYTFKDFGILPTDIHSNVSVIAQYEITYRVLFMNDDAVYNTQWVVSGNNAVSPSGTPTRTTTAQYTYSFVGWNRNQNSTTADSTALQNITAPRTLYAAYSHTIRKYTVYFYNGSTLLQTVQNVSYGSSASYTGATPVSPDGSADDYPFEGWNPPPTNIQGNTSCHAQFGTPLNVVEIEDSWDQIIAAINNGTAASKYSIGNYKPLDLGAQGTVNMQIVGKSVDALADGSGNATLTWISRELLTTSRRMNPDIVRNYLYPDSPSWTAGSDANLWITQTRYCPGSLAKATWKVTSETEGTLTVSYSTSSSSLNNKLTVKVNGEVVAKNYHAATYADHTVDCSAGDEITVSAEYTLSLASDYVGCVRLTSTGTITVEATVEDAPRRLFDCYEEGTGTIGGWGETEMRSYIKDTVKPLIPENVRSHIVEVTKYSTGYDTAGTNVSNGETIDDVWIPSFREVFGGTSFETQGPIYNTVFNSADMRKKMKVNGSSEVAWWMRSAYSTETFRYVSHNGGNTNITANYSYGVAIGFCT